MKKEIHINPIAYTYNPAHKGAPYTINGEKWMNAGQLKQIIRIACLFGKLTGPDNLPYNEGSDIPELHESVKSSRATLVNMVLGEDFQTTLETYMATTASTFHSWVILIDEQVITYIMDMDEFKEFTETFAGFDKSRKVIRYREDSTKMVKWFESRL